MSPKIVDKQLRRSEIALKALDLFAEQGFESPTVSEIASHQGIAKGGLYDYFRSKDELVFASLRAWLESLEVAAKPMFDGVSEPADRLRAWVAAYTEVALSDPRTAKVMIMMQRLVMNKKYKRHQKTMHAMMEASLHEVSELILQGVRQGVFKKSVRKDAKRIAMNLCAYMDGITMHYFVMGDFIDIKKNMMFYLDELLESISEKSPRTKGK
jgi:AcrR family transcriptional regulator